MNKVEHRHTSNFTGVPASDFLDITSLREIHRALCILEGVSLYDKSLICQHARRLIVNAEETPENWKFLKDIRVELSNARVLSQSAPDREPFPEFGAKDWTFVEMYWVLECLVGARLNEYAPVFEKICNDYQLAFVEQELLIELCSFENYSKKQLENTIRHVAVHWYKCADYDTAKTLVFALELASSFIMTKVTMTKEELKKFVRFSEIYTRYMRMSLHRYTLFDRVDVTFTAKKEEFFRWFENQVRLVQSDEFRNDYRDKKLKQLSALGDQEYFGFKDHLRIVRDSQGIARAEALSRTLRFVAPLIESGDDDYFTMYVFAIIMQSKHVPLEKAMLFLERDDEEHNILSVRVQFNMGILEYPCIVQNFNRYDIYYDGSYINTKTARIAIYTWFAIVERDFESNVLEINLNELLL